MKKPKDTVKVPGPKTARRRPSAFSRVITWLFLLVLVGSIAAGGAAFYGYQEYTLPGPLAATKVHTIGKGLSTPEIAADLQDAGVISDARVFSAMAYVTGTRTRLKAGEYEFKAQASMRDVMAMIASGKSIAYKLSIPEGWTSEMAVARVNANEILEGPPAAVPPEGSIMPDTYVFRRGMTRQKLVEDMQAAQTKLLDELWEARAPLLAVDSKEEAVILASIVEKETGVAEERPLVASVFMNRLKKGMRLQSDPTIIYGIAGGKGKLDRKLTRTDIETTTPYNTYRISGLPPGPIANPGRAALEAVLNPQLTEYLYFVADGTGGHAFAATLAEHNANVKTWRKIAGNAAAAAAADAADTSAQDPGAADTPDAAADGTPPAETPPAATPPVTADGEILLPDIPADDQQAETPAPVQPPADGAGESATTASEPGLAAVPQPLPAEPLPPVVPQEAAANSGAAPQPDPADASQASAAPGPDGNSPQAAAEAATPEATNEAAPAEQTPAAKAAAPIPIPQAKPKVAAVQPQTETQPQTRAEPKPGSVVRVGGTLVAIPKRNPRR